MKDAYDISDIFGAAVALCYLAFLVYVLAQGVENLVNARYKNRYAD